LVSPAAIAQATGDAAATAPAACFVDSVSQSMPEQEIWFVVLVAIALVIAIWRTAHGKRRRTGGRVLRMRIKGVILQTLMSASSYERFFAL
jgi:hypothetical protein